MVLPFNEVGGFFFNQLFVLPDVANIGQNDREHSNCCRKKHELSRDKISDQRRDRGTHLAIKKGNMILVMGQVYP